MIAVIADDFTGAAELAGISLRYGLSAEIFTGDIIHTNTDVLVISTDSRSMQKTGAIKKTRERLQDIIKLCPAFIYKKIDSVLRGHVLEEIKIQMELQGLNRALLFPANPTLGRTIEGGEYFIHGKKITDTDFVNDPEFCISSSRATKMLGDESIQLLKHTDPLPETGIFMAESSSAGDYEKWAFITDQKCTVAGAGDFFDAFLQRKFRQSRQPAYTLHKPHIYISGTSFEKSRRFTREINKSRNCVAYLSEQILKSEKAGDEIWMNRLTDIIKEQNRAIIAIDDTSAQSGYDAFYLRKIMSQVVKKIIQRTGIKEIFIEGGSTAAAVLEALQINKLTALNEVQRGVVRMKAGEMYITVKPGSYTLPEEIIKLYGS